MAGLISLLKQLINAVAVDERSSFLSVIYSEESVVLTVLQQLGELEKSFVFKLLLVDRPIKEQLFSFWTCPLVNFQASLGNLVSIGLLRQHVESQSFDLHPDFRRVLLESIITTQKNDNHSRGINSSVWTLIIQDKPFNVPTVDETKWHALLERTITASTLIGSDSDIDRVILRLGFGATPTPPVAFRFVLADVNNQLWTLLSEFILLIERQRDYGGLTAVAEVIKVIAGVMVVVSLQNDSRKSLISVTSQNTLVKRTVQFLQDLDCIRSLSDGNPFQQTSFTVGPTSPALFQQSKARQDLLLGAKLILDSNMHVTAYTRSNLQVKLISLFCEVHRVMGHVLAGVLTRTSVQNAIDSGGVSSESIIQFLSGNLHPQCGDKLPTNVSLQIRLWEADCPRNRLNLEPCVLLSWRGDRTEQASRAISQVKQLAESSKGLLFTKQDPDGRMYLGIKASVAKNIFPQS